MFIVDLFIKSETWEQPRHPSVSEQAAEPWYTRAMGIWLSNEKGETADPQQHGGVSDALAS